VVDFCKKFLKEKHVSVSPGSAFGTVADQYVRVSLASSSEDIETGLRRLCEFIKSEKEREY
jgi:aspartate/methionine/tyrosine aminotransferase